ncbi:MAG: hypothetical protein V2A73_06575, partial [Pseudomonadota bacterium]
MAMKLSLTTTTVLLFAQLTGCSSGSTTIGAIDASDASIPDATGSTDARQGTLADAFDSANAGDIDASDASIPDATGSTDAHQGTLADAFDSANAGDIDASDASSPDATGSTDAQGTEPDAFAGNNAAPVVIPYGGLASGAIDGRVNVFVLDVRDGKPIADASVQVGSLSKTTDDNGLAIFFDDSLSGPQDITASASGFLTASWFGANGANITILLEPAIPPAGTPTVPSAEVQGTIKGFDQLTPPQQNHWTIAYVGYSWSKTGGAENAIT